METTAAAPMPRLNAPAPQFEALATTGPIKLSDYAGKWVILFSHPGDFTPVCSTEFAALAHRKAEFEKRNAQLIGLSIDSIYAHLAWLESIEALLGTPIDFPVIADLDMNVAQLYGMIHPGASTTSTVRSLFFIDPTQIVRAMIHYPLTTGRSVDEILRVLDALNVTADTGLVTPANWKPGEACLIPAPVTRESAAKRLSDGNAEVKAWYLAFKRRP